MEQDKNGRIKKGSRAHCYTNYFRNHTEQKKGKCVLPMFCELSSRKLRVLSYRNACRTLSVVLLRQTRVSVSFHTLTRDGENARHRNSEHGWSSTELERSSKTHTCQTRVILISTCRHKMSKTKLTISIFLRGCWNEILNLSVITIELPCQVIYATFRFSSVVTIIVL